MSEVYGLDDRIAEHDDFKFSQPPYNPSHHMEGVTADLRTAPERRVTPNGKSVLILTLGLGFWTGDDSQTCRVIVQGDQAIAEISAKLLPGHTIHMFTFKHNVTYQMIAGEPAPAVITPEPGDLIEYYFWGDDVSEMVLIDEKYPGPLDAVLN